jgi:hypothetical protein
LLIVLLTGDIVVPVEPTVCREIALVILFEVFTGCCFGGVAAFVAAVDFVVVVCCVAADDDDDDTADVGGVAADAIGGFTVFAIPHKRDSVVLTTLRSGLLGSHIFALSSDDIGLLGELLPLPPDDGSDDDCCANTWVLLQIAKTSIPTINENATKIKFVWFMLNYLHIIFIYTKNLFFIRLSCWRKY